MVGKCLDNLKHYLMYFFDDEIHENMNHANIEESVYFDTIFTLMHYCLHVTVQLKPILL